MKTEKTLKDYENKLKEEIEELFKKGFGEDNPFKLREEYPKQYVLEFGKYCFQKAKELIKEEIKDKIKSYKEIGGHDLMIYEFKELLELIDSQEKTSEKVLFYHTPDTLRGCKKEFMYDEEMPMICGEFWNGKQFLCDECKKNNSQQHQKFNRNVKNKSCDVKKDEISSTRTGVLKSSGVEDHLPNIELSSADTNNQEGDLKCSN